MLVLHHLENSRSQRILWLLEELELDFEIRRYARDPETMLAPESLKSIHPLGRSPVLVDGDLTVAESGVIIEHLANQHGGGRFLPRNDSPSALDCRYWLHYAEGSLMPLLLLKLAFSRLSQSPIPIPLRPIGKLFSVGMERSFLTPRIGEHLAYIDDHLEGTGWFAGDDLTVADFQMSFPLEAAASRGLVGEERYPHIAAFLAGIHQRPAYRRALEKGGPYDYAN